MDRAEVVSLTATLMTPAGRFEHCLETRETTPLERGAREYKVYAPGVPVSIAAFRPSGLTGRRSLEGSGGCGTVRGARTLCRICADRPGCDNRAVADWIARLIAEK